MLPLQQVIAGIAGFILMHLGLEVQVDGIYLFVNQRLVEIAPHCAGLKLLFTNLYVGLILAHWRNLWASSTRIVLFFGGVLGISMIANLTRSTLLSYWHGTDRTALFDWLHAGWGGDVYSALTLLALAGFGILISWMAERMSLSYFDYGSNG
jgi:cyanoexosortase B